MRFQDNGLNGWNVIYTTDGTHIINDFCFVDSIRGWAVTRMYNDTAYIMKTTDGGYSFQIIQRYQPGFNGSGLAIIQMIDANTGYIGGGDGNSIVLKTTNGGNNWTDLNFTTGIYINGMKFVNADTGWITDEYYGGTWRTINGGISWQGQAGGFRNISFINSRTGWAINYDKIYKTTNSGENWNLLVTLNGQIGDIFFVSLDTGWLTGGSLGTGIAMTTNGGLNWIPQPNPGAVSGMKLFFINNKKGWLGNHLYKINAYIDSIWGSQYIPSIYANWKAKFIDTIRGWTGSVQLLHTTDGGGPVTHITNSKEETANNYKLWQNYPNPFNQSSIINVQCSIGGDVKLKVYDITGKELKILIDEYKPSGKYSVRFDSGELPSGIYFYSLIVDGIVMDTKKAILIK